MHICERRQARTSDSRGERPEIRARFQYCARESRSLAGRSSGREAVPFRTARCTRPDCRSADIVPVWTQPAPTPCRPVREASSRGAHRPEPSWRPAVHSPENHGHLYPEPSGMGRDRRECQDRGDRHSCMGHHRQVSGSAARVGTAIRLIVGALRHRPDTISADSLRLRDAGCHAVPDKRAYFITATAATAPRWTMCTVVIGARPSTSCMLRRPSPHRRRSRSGIHPCIHRTPERRKRIVQAVSRVPKLVRYGLVTPPGVLE